MKINYKKLFFFISVTVGVNIFASQYAEIYMDNDKNIYSDPYTKSSVNKKYIDSNKQKNTNIYKNYQNSVNETLNETIMELADKLLLSSKLDDNNFNDLSITSFVDLHKLNKTTHFGRTLGESMFDELFVRGFNVNDFRGQNNLTINANGEYFISRDVNLLKQNTRSGYILVGTYSMFESKVLVNARIIDNQSGKIVASARSYYASSDCTIMENCKKPRSIKIVSDKHKKDKYFSNQIGNQVQNEIPSVKKSHRLSLIQ